MLPSLSEIAKYIWVVLMLIGIFFVVLGLASHFVYDKFQVEIRGWAKLVTIVLGGVLFIFGWTQRSAVPVTCLDIKITSPTSETQLKAGTTDINVKGSYSEKPSDDMPLALFLVKHDSNGAVEVWPQRQVQSFDPTTKTWTAIATMGGVNSYSGTIVAALLGQTSKVWWDVYFKYASPPPGNFVPLTAMPADLVECDKIQNITKP